MLIKCLECSKEMSDFSDNCPHCGFPFKRLKENYIDNSSCISTLCKMFLTLSEKCPTFDKRFVVNLNNNGKSQTKTDVYTLTATYEFDSELCDPEYGAAYLLQWSLVIHGEQSDLATFEFGDVIYEGCEDNLDNVVILSEIIEFLELCHKDSLLLASMASDYFVIGMGSDLLRDKYYGDLIKICDEIIEEISLNHNMEDLSDGTEEYINEANELSLEWTDQCESINDEYECCYISKDEVDRLFWLIEKLAEECEFYTSDAFLINENLKAFDNESYCERISHEATVINKIIHEKKVYEECILEYETGELNYSYSWINNEILKLKRNLAMQGW